MPFPYSDDESSDSDSGIRFKTANTRHINKSSYDNRTRNPERTKPSDHYRRNRSRSKERSHRRERRSTSKDYRTNRHRSRTPDNYRRYKERETKYSSEKYKKSPIIHKTNSKDNVETKTSKSESNDKKKNSSYNNLETIIKINAETDQYGPKLPPKTETASSSSKDDIVIGPALPSSMKISTIPKSQEENLNVHKKSEQINKEYPSVIGPTLPPHLKLSETVIPCSSQQSLHNKSDESDSDNDIVGPLPVGESSNNPIFLQLEERALEMKLNGLNKVETDNIVREEWMLELPDVHTANLGLGPRQFRAKGVPDMSDRSSWTDTPEDKLKKASTKKKPSKSDIKKEAELEHLKKRDLEQESIVEKHKKKKKRDKSLLDIHQDKLNEKKGEESSDKAERRPFSRDIDLKANRFDEAQKKSILKKAQLLDNRFSSGEAKFL